MKMFGVSSVLQYRIINGDSCNYIKNMIIYINIIIILIIMLTDNELSKAVDLAIRNDGRSLEQLCDDFNRTYKKDINAGVKKPLNKDFISRLRNNRFKVRSERVSYFCEYIGVDLKQRSSSFKVIEQQAKELELFFVEKRTKNMPELKELRNFLDQIFNSK